MHQQHPHIRRSKKWIFCKINRKKLQFMSLASVKLLSQWHFSPESVFAYLGLVRVKVSNRVSVFFFGIHAKFNMLKAPAQSQVLEVQVQVGLIAFKERTPHRATKRHLSYGITQCYLPPDRGRLNPSQLFQVCKNALRGKCDCAKLSIGLNIHLAACGAKQSLLDYYISAH